MKASDRIAAERHGDSLSVSGKWETSVAVLGASVPTSAGQSNDLMTSFYVSPNRTKKGVVAIRMFAPGQGKHSYAVSGEFLVTTGWKDGEPYINLDEAWTPLSGRLGQVSSRGISVEIFGVVFCSQKPYQSSDSKAVSAFCVVPGDVICRYLAGDIEAHEVLEAVTKRQEEEQARLRLPEFEERLAAVQADADNWRRRYDRLRDDLGGQVSQLAQETKVLKHRVWILENLYIYLWRSANGLAKIVGRWSWLGGRRRSAVELFNKQFHLGGVSAFVTILEDRTKEQCEGWFKQLA